MLDPGGEFLDQLRVNCWLPLLGDPLGDLGEFVEVVLPIAVGPIHRSMGAGHPVGHDREPGQQGSSSPPRHVVGPLVHTFEHAVRLLALFDL